MSASEHVIVVSAPDLDDEVVCVGDDTTAHDSYDTFLAEHDHTMLVELVGPDGAVIASDWGWLR